MLLYAQAERSVVNVTTRLQRQKPVLYVQSSQPVYVPAQVVTARILKLNALGRIRQ